MTSEPQTSGGTLKDAIVVVIGGSSGIGHEIARQAKQLGATLLITGRDEARLHSAAERLGGVRASSLDAHEEDELRAFFSDLPIADHVVSMVGESMSGDFLTTTSATMFRVLHSKFWTNWLIGKFAAPKLRDGGSITFTSGTGGRPHEISASYVANQGVGVLVQGLAVELAPRVRVNAVAPTFMDTQFWRHMPSHELESAKQSFAAHVPLRRLGTVAEVAAAYVYLMSNGFVTGQTLPVDGGVML